MENAYLEKIIQFVEYEMDKEAGVADTIKGLASRAADGLRAGRARAGAAVGAAKSGLANATSSAKARAAAAADVAKGYGRRASDAGKEFGRRATDAAKGYGRRASDAGKEFGRRATDNVKSHARDLGDNVHNMRVAPDWTSRANVARAIAKNPLVYGGAGGLAAAGVAGYAAGHKKKAGMGDALRAAANAGKADARAVPNSVNRVREAWKLRGTGSRNTVREAVGALAKNKAVQAGAGALGASAAAGAALASSTKRSG